MACFSYSSFSASLWYLESYSEYGNSTGVFTGGGCGDLTQHIPPDRDLWFLKYNTGHPKYFCPTLVRTEEICLKTGEYHWTSTGKVYK